MGSFIIKDNNISFEDVFTIINKNLKISLNDDIVEKVTKSRNTFDEKIKNSDQKFYGINTGFGDLHNVKIKDDQLGLLQENLIKSHACGVGNSVDSKIVKLMLLLKIISLTKGYSGIKIQTVNRLLFFYNNEMY